MADLVMELAGCSRDEAERALETYKDPVAAIDALLQKPQTQGDKYIPEKPNIDSGLSDEQKALCERGRWLQDKVNVVFSVAHSKTRTQPDPLELADQETPSVSSAAQTSSEQQS
jgi:hypothetical protein